MKAIYVALLIAIPLTGHCFGLGDIQNAVKSADKMVNQSSGTGQPMSKLSELEMNDVEKNGHQILAELKTFEDGVNDPSDELRKAATYIDQTKKIQSMNLQHGIADKGILDSLMNDIYQEGIVVQAIHLLGIANKASESGISLDDKTKASIDRTIAGMDALIDKQLANNAVLDFHNKLVLVQHANNNSDTSKYCVDDIFCGNLSPVDMIQKLKPLEKIPFSNVRNAEERRAVEQEYIAKTIDRFPKLAPENYALIYRSYSNDYQDFTDFSGAELNITKDNIDLLTKNLQICKPVFLVGKYAASDGTTVKVQFYPLIDKNISLEWKVYSIEKQYSYSTEAGSMTVIKKYTDKYGDNIVKRNSDKYGDLSNQPPLLLFNDKQAHILDAKYTDPTYIAGYDKVFANRASSVFDKCKGLDESAEKNVNATLDLIKDK